MLSSCDKSYSERDYEVSYPGSCEFRYSIIKIPFRKRSALTLFTDTCVVTARLLIMVKHTATFLLELQSTWVFLI